MAAKKGGGKKLPHVLVLSKFLAYSLKFLVAPRRTQKFLNARALEFRNALRRVRNIFYDAVRIFKFRRVFILKKEKPRCAVLLAREGFARVDC